jgi:hypothetical protein
MRFVRLAEAYEVTRQLGMPRTSTVIYALIDKRDGRVRYVGKTDRPVNDRLAFHLRNPTNRAMAEWFRSLAAEGRKPAIRVLERVSRAEWEDAERGWIQWFRDRGDLLNVDPGGVWRSPSGRALGVRLGEYQPPTGVRVPPPPPGILTPRRWRRLKM